MEASRPPAHSRETHALGTAADFATAARSALASMPTSCRPGGRGWSAAVACILEATAAKPGNVHPAAAFPDLSHADLVAAALAIAPVMDAAVNEPLGRTIRTAIEASRRVSRSNANLGIVLAIAPLAALPVERGDLMAAIRAGAVTRRLQSVDRDDAADVWEAIATANPGGMGTVDACDLASPPPDELVAAMRLAADRDEVARLWTTGFSPLLDGLVADLLADLRSAPLEEAIITSFLRQLARRPDTHIARRHGAAVAADVSRQAAAVLAAVPADRRAATTAFDRSLRDPTRINPGTTADLVAAALYILVYDGHLEPLDV